MSSREEVCEHTRWWNGDEEELLALFWLGNVRWCVWVLFRDESKACQYALVLWLFSYEL